jgi:hypothetical protein
MIDPRNKLMLKACSRCHGDLLFDSYEEDFACMQCGRHFGIATVLTALNTAENTRVEVPMPALAA